MLISKFTEFKRHILKYGLYFSWRPDCRNAALYDIGNKFQKHSGQLLCIQHRRRPAGGQVLSCINIESSKLAGRDHA